MADLNTWLSNLYRQYRDKVYSYCFKKLRSEAEAEELLSQVFLEATRCADRFDRTRASESTWLYAICRNLINRHLRDSYTHKRIIQTYWDTEAPYLAQAEEVEQYNHRDELAGFLAELTQVKREIIILSCYYDLSPKEIAQKLRLSYVNVCTLKYRALREVRKKITKKPGGV
jgi:RNA polymerase sigma-70 factor (ECF subfamily)